MLNGEGHPMSSKGMLEGGKNQNMALLKNKKCISVPF